MKKSYTYITAALILVVSFLTQVFSSATASAALSDEWQPGHIISDSIFTNAGSMSAGGIQQFLNSKVPVCDTYGTQPSEYGGGTRAQWGQANYGQSTFTCLKDYAEGGRSAAQIIYDKAQAYSINPQVLIVLLQKEQGLVTDTWPLNIQYRTATGYGCPDTAPCDSQYYGLTNQVDWAAKMFRAILNASPTWTTPYILGNNYIQYNPNSSCGGTVVNIENRSTQALYNYTPYQPNQGALAAGWGTASCGAYGNRNFYLFFQSWFGSTRDGKCFVSSSGGPIITGITFRKFGYRYLDQGNAVAYTGTSTDCIESHTWNVGLQSWQQNKATNHKVAPPDVSNVQYADLDGDGFDEPVMVELNNTLSGYVEFRVWSKNMDRWLSQTISDVPATNLSNGLLTFADTNGDGKDEPVFILLSATLSGKVEFQILNNDLKTFKAGVVSHMPLFDRANGTVVFADVEGNGVDEPVLILYKNTGSGNVEFHTWNATYSSWRFNTASQLPAIDPNNGFITFADVDGNGVDEAVLISLRGTQSGKIEFHTWHLGVTSWRYHTATNATVLN